jgi:hypothetical protein
MNDIAQCVGVCSQMSSLLVYCLYSVASPMQTSNAYEAQRHNVGEQICSLFLSPIWIFFQNLSRQFKFH